MYLWGPVHYFTTCVHNVVGRVPEKNRIHRKCVYNYVSKFRAFELGSPQWPSVRQESLQWSPECWAAGALSSCRTKGNKDATSAQGQRVTSASSVERVNHGELEAKIQRKWQQRMYLTQDIGALKNGHTSSFLLFYLIQPTSLLMHETHQVQLRAWILQ